VDGLLALLDGDVTGPVNIGNPHEVTVNEFAALVLELTGSSSSVEYRVLPDDDPKVRRPDISLAQRELGWNPVIPLREGLARPVAHHSQQLAR
jgi:nucleoside-diphosphate-sugar epimerase